MGMVEGECYTTSGSKINTDAVKSSRLRNVCGAEMK